MKQVLEYSKIHFVNHIKLFCDNNLTINIADNLVQHDRTKYIEIDQYFIKEKLNSELISTKYILFGNQLTNMLVKSLPT